MRRIALAVLIASCCAYAQDNTCASLLQHGIYDTYSQQSGALSSAQFHTNLCNAYNQYKQDQQRGSVQAQYGVFGGGGEYTASQLDVIGKAMCTSTDSSSFSQSDLSIASSTIDPQAVLAFSECMQQYNYGLRTNTDIRESDEGHINISINYVPAPGVSPNLPLKYVRVDPPTAWNCGGTLWDKRAGGVNLDSTVYSLSCERNFSPVTIDGRRYKAAASTITISTGNSTVTRDFPADPDSPPPVPQTFPVGSIIPFWGKIADANAQKAFGWWPCDGTKITDNVSPLYNTDAPNLNNVFLRGAVDAAGSPGGSDSFPIPGQTITSTYSGWSPTPAGGVPEMWVLKGGMGFASGSVQKVQGTYSGTTVPTVPSYRTVVYLIRVR